MKRVAQDAMQMILIMRVKNSTNQRNTNHTLSVCIAHAFGGEQRFIEEVCCYEKFESQPAPRKFLLAAKRHSVKQLSALSQ